mgnify:CR=1 FL=1
MKRTLITLVTILLIFTAAGCGSTTLPASAAESPTPTEAAPTPSPTPEPTPAPTPEPTPTPTPMPGQAEYETGMQLYQEEKMLDAIASFKASLDLGYIKAAEQMGTVCYNGYNASNDGSGSWKNDYRESKKWYADAIALWQAQAEAGDAEALYELGRMYAYGYGVARDQGKADNYFAQAAALGHEGALKRTVAYAAPTGDARDRALSALPAQEPYYVPQLSSLGFLVFRSEGELKVTLVQSGLRTYTLNEKGEEVYENPYEGFDELFTGIRVVDVPDFVNEDGDSPLKILSFPMVAAEDYQNLELLKIIPSYRINDLYDYLDINVPSGGLYDQLYGKSGRYGISKWEDTPYDDFCFGDYSYEMFRNFYSDLIPAEYRVPITMWTAINAPRSAALLAGVPTESVDALGVKNPDQVYNANGEAVVFTDANGMQRVIYTYSVDKGNEMEVYDRFTETLLFVCDADQNNRYGVDITKTRNAIPLLQGATIDDYTNVIIVTNYGNDWTVFESIYPMSDDGSIDGSTILYSNADWARIYLLITPSAMQVTAAEILQ